MLRGTTIKSSRNVVKSVKLLPKDIDSRSYKYLKENDYFVAFIVSMPQVSAVADSIKEAVSELAIVWDLIKESYQANEFPLPN
jgi:predicted RNase H-like HicB family nuclease